MNVIDPLRVRYQPAKSNLCGQACIATVLDIDLDDAARLVGRKGLTGTRHIREAFAKRDIHMGPGVRGDKVERNTVYMARVHWPDSKKTHWILIDLDGTIIDPGWGINPHTEGAWPEGTRITSAYPLDLSERERNRVLDAALRLLNPLKGDDFTNSRADRSVQDAVRLLSQLRHLGISR